MAQKEEPSMEEILSSIKRIIAEESDVPPASHQRAPEPEHDPESEVLELSDPVFDEERVPEHQDEEPSAEEAPAIAEAPVAPTVRPSSTVRATESVETLLSRTSAEASRQALASLSKMVVKADDPAAENTLEGLVRELLRPMLKDWLDANLPRIVQTTVDREVARISRG